MPELTDEMKENLAQQVLMNKASMQAAFASMDESVCTQIALLHKRLLDAHTETGFSRTESLSIIEAFAGKAQGR